MTIEKEVLDKYKEDKKKEEVIESYSKMLENNKKKYKYWRYIGAVFSLLLIATWFVALTTFKIDYVCNVEGIGEIHREVSCWDIMTGDGYGGTMRVVLWIVTILCSILTLIGMIGSIAFMIGAFALMPTMTSFTLSGNVFGLGYTLLFRVAEDQIMTVLGIIITVAVAALISIIPSAIYGQLVLKGIDSKEAVKKSLNPMEELFSNITMFK